MNREFFTTNGHPWVSDCCVLHSAQPDNADMHSILKEIGRGERIALSKLAVEHLEKTGRPFRIAIDIAIWQFQNQAGQGGANPALRTLYYRLLKLLALPIHPVFIYDGKNKPLTKRNKTVTSYGTCVPNEMSKKLIQAFRFPYHTAPGEAEAECALLQKKGIVDAVMSQDVDALMFGSTMTLRDWSKEGTRGNKTASHVNVLRAEETRTKTGLDSDGMILVALLSGGDYNTDGVPGFGPSLACEIAKAQFGSELLELLRQGDVDGVREWRDRLQYELETNESGYFRKRHKSVKIPEDFPDSTVLGYYTNPAVSSPEQMQKIRAKCAETWDTDIDVPALRVYVAEKFEWLYRNGAKKLIRTLAPSLLANRLRRGLKNTTITSPENIKERRMHFINDGMPELRLEVVPSDVVGLNIEDEEDSPAYKECAAADGVDPIPNQDETNDLGIDGSEEPSAPVSPSKSRNSPPWDATAPQKIWVPETVVKLGIGAFVEAWEQKQRDILSDPKKFAARKCPKSKPKPRVGNAGIRPGALEGFFTSSKHGVAHDMKTVSPSKSITRTELQDHSHLTANEAPRTPSKKASKSQADLSSPTIDRYFSRSLLSPIAGLDPRKDGIGGIELPPKARYSALGLHGSEVRSGLGEQLLETRRSISGHKHSRPATAESTETDQRPRQYERAASTSGQSSSDNITGASFSESIWISSSPPPPQESPIPPERDSTLVALPQSVTQRTKRGPRQPLPLSASNVQSKPVTRSKVSPPLRTSQHCSVPATRTLKGHFPTAKAVVLTRDSLPGTWKEADDDTLLILEAGSPKRRLPRVSCLDLTTD